MTIDLNLVANVNHRNVYDDPGLTRILAYIRAIKNQGDLVMAMLDELKAQVHANTAVVGSAIELIKGLSSKLEELKNDPAAIQELADELKATDQALGEAVAANTPSA